MRELEVRRDDAIWRLIAAERQRDASTLSHTYDQANGVYEATLAAVLSARAAIFRLEEDARRANVPPGWLRQP